MLFCMHYPGNSNQVGDEMRERDAEGKRCETRMRNEGRATEKSLIFELPLMALACELTTDTHSRILMHRFTVPLRLWSLAQGRRREYSSGRGVQHSRMASNQGGNPTCTAPWFPVSSLMHQADHMWEVHWHKMAAITSTRWALNTGKNEMGLLRHGK